MRSAQAAPPRTSAAVFAALGDETRLRMVARLCREGPLSIARLTDGFGITRQAISKHLRVMKKAGVVRGSRQGRESVWQIQQQRLADAERYLGAIAAQWDDRLGRLKKFVEA